MKPEIKKLWIEALRSGKYQQTQGQLARFEAEDEYEPGYCCLGVLCDISGMKWEQHMYNLPKEIMDWAGLTTEDPDLYEDEETGATTTASEANDDQGLNFLEIANLIEENL